MQQSATPAPPSNSATFAGLLATFAAPGLKRPPERDLDGLEDDIATLSYERALRAHGRYRSVAPTSFSPRPPEQESLSIFEVVPDNVEPITAPVLAQEDFSQSEAQPPLAAPLAPEALKANEATSQLNRYLKSTSITIRLTTEECAQLRERAAEAGLTVSAYLRSCTFEAESLRAMVRDTVSKLKSESTNDREPDKQLHQSKSTFRRAWWVWLWQYVHRSRQQTARA